MRNKILRPSYVLAISIALIIAEKFGVHDLKVVAWTLHGCLLLYTGVIFFYARRAWKKQDAELRRLLREFHVMTNEIRNPRPEHYNRAPWN